MNNSSEQILDDSINTTDAMDALTTFDHIIINANLATFSAQYGFDTYADNKDSISAAAKSTPYGQLENAAIGIKDRKIAWIGAHTQITPYFTHYQRQQITDADGHWITPGLIDCHTHIKILLPKVAVLSQQFVPLAKPISKNCLHKVKNACWRLSKKV